MNTRDEFELWLAHMDDALDSFRGAVPPRLRKRLDGTRASVSALEGWLLERFDSVDSLRLEPALWDGAARYLGETLRGLTGGKWDIELKRKRDVHYRLPVLVDSRGALLPHSPLTLVSATIDRRQGDFLASVFAE